VVTVVVPTSHTLCLMATDSRLSLAKQLSTPSGVLGFNFNQCSRAYKSSASCHLSVFFFSAHYVTAVFTFPISDSGREKKAKQDLDNPGVWPLMISSCVAPRLSGRWLPRSYDIFLCMVASRSPYLIFYMRVKYSGNWHGWLSGVWYGRLRLFACMRFRFFLFFTSRTMSLTTLRSNQYWFVIPARKDLPNRSCIPSLYQMGGSGWLAWLGWLCTKGWQDLR